MEIQIGEYVRTDKGYIAKINEFIPHYTEGRRLGKTEKVKENYLLLGAKQCEIIESIDYSIPPCYPSDEELEKIKKHIVKHSFNIIDLIEVGDYVNGEEVVTVYGYDEDGNDRDDKGIIEVDNDYAYGVYLEDINIKSIVTKEQFKQVEYKVED